MSMTTFHSQIPSDKNLLDLISELKTRVETLEDALIEMTSCISSLQNQIEAVDARIDIILEEKEEDNVRRLDRV